MLALYHIVLEDLLGGAALVCVEGEDPLVGLEEVIDTVIGIARILRPVLEIEFR